jgi:hypothetical protein
MTRGPPLFDLQGDPGESYDVGLQRPAIPARMLELVESRKAADLANPRGFR